MKKICERVNKVIYFAGIEGSEWNGILNHITKECGGNVHEKGIVNITSSGDYRSKPWEVTNYGWNRVWASNSVPNSWICFDFKGESVSLQHYTLKSHNWSGNCLIQWTTEGSYDGNTWEIRDNRNTTDLCRKSIVKIYKCSASKSNEFFRFIRRTQTGKDSDDCNFLILTTIEFFGLLKKR
jgi:hypothetical protein